jgi:hypothetical protein
MEADSKQTPRQVRRKEMSMNTITNKPAFIRTGPGAYVRSVDVPGTAIVEMGAWAPRLMRLGDGRLCSDTVLWELPEGAYLERGRA